MAQPLNKLCFATTHNSYNAAKGKKMHLLPCQTYGIKRQLEDGIRGFMLDVYEHNEQLLVYHSKKVLGSQTLKDLLIVYKDWMQQHPNEVVAIIFENHVRPERLLKEINACGLNEKLIRIHKNGPMPDASEVLLKGQQLLAFTEYSTDTMPDELLAAWQLIWDTPWNIPPNSEMPNQVGRGSKSNPFFLMNHWINRGKPTREDAVMMNDESFLKQRITDLYSKHKTYPNFVGVNYHQIGSVVKVCDWVQEQMKKGD